MSASALPIRAALGRAVRRLRLAGGRSQDAFAADAGVHRTYIGSVERGEVNVSLDNLERLAHTLDVPLSQLLAEAEAEQSVGSAVQRSGATAPRPGRGRGRPEGT